MHYTAMPAARCILCDRLLMGMQPDRTLAVANPEALVLCAMCQALPSSDRRARRGQIMMRMLDAAIGQRQRRHG
jgi:hypothetical protein